MVDYSKFSRDGDALVLKDGVFVILGIRRRFDGNSYFHLHDFELYIRNKDEVLVYMGKIFDEESLETILNLIEHGKDLVLYK